MNEAISKAQYQLKATLFYFLFSKINIVTIIFAYLFSNNINTFLILYLSLALLFYKFIFNATKMDNLYKIFMLNIINNFIRNLRS